MQSQTSETTTRVSARTDDLSALAWVADAVAKSLETASKALKRYRKESEAALDTDLASVNDSQLRLARQNIHQAVGALEMVGFEHAAMVLRGMETVVQQFVVQPVRYTDESAKVLEQSAFAVTEYVGQVLAGRNASPLGLFPQYKAVQMLAGADRIHPADLWPHDWRWVEVDHAEEVEPLGYVPAVRARLDQDILRVMKTGSHRASAELCQVCQGLARGEQQTQSRRFWSISAGFFDALANKLISADLYVKRAASRILLQFTTLSKGGGALPSDRLAHDLVFFCMQAGEPLDGAALALQAVRRAYRLAGQTPVDYEHVRYGRYDPSQLGLALKRIESLKEIWSAYAAGEVKRARNAADQVGLVADSLSALYPAASKLETALRGVQAQVNQTQAIPDPELAMELATASLFLEATFEDFDIDSPLLLSRTEELAERLASVAQGQPAKPIAPWMEELYRKVSDRQTMGTVVGELRANLAEAEGSLDQFFRTPQDVALLGKVPALLGQMKGVLTVLGVYSAAQAVDHMRQTVEGFILASEGDPGAAPDPAQVESLGNSMGVLGLMVDMLNYQSALAKKLFVFDVESGELKAIMGREELPHDEGQNDLADLEGVKDEVPRAEPFTAPAELTALTVGQTTDLQALEALASQAALADQSALAAGVKQVVQAVQSEDSEALAQALEQVEKLSVPATSQNEPLPPMEDIEDADLKEIFLEEAREVIANGLSALDSLQDAPTDESLLTDLRRAFHTLKGSSRMVGLNEFGEAGWALEQLLNLWRAEQRPATSEMREVCTQALNALGLWVEDVAQSRQAGWSSKPFRDSADAMRNEGRFLALPESLVVQQAVHTGVSVQPEVEPLEGPIDSVVEIETQEFTEEIVSDGVLSEEPLINLQAVELASPGDVDNSLVETEELRLDFTEAPTTQEAVEFVVSEDIDSFAPELSKGNTVQELAFSPDLLQTAIEAAPEFAAGSVDISDEIQSISLVESSVDLELIQDIAENTEIHVDEVLDITDGFDLTAPNPEAAVDAQVIKTGEGAESLQQLITLSDEQIEAPDLNLELDLSEVLHSIDVDDLDLTDPEFQDTPEQVKNSEDAQAASALLDLDFHELSDLSSAPMALNAAQETRQIGNIQISEALFNVYLSEAETWHQQLDQALSKLLGGGDEDSFSTAIARAHSLAGSSGTVGFESLSGLARSIEHALERLHSHGVHSDWQIETIQRGCDQVQALLHQFAAGLLKDADAAVVESINAIQGLPELIVPKESVLFEDVPDSGLEYKEPNALSSREDNESSFAHDGVLTPDALQDAAHAITVSEESVDKHADLDVADAFDADLFPIFEEEAADLFPMLASSLREWVSRPNDMGPRAQVLRALHTLKGSARLAGAMRLGELAHRMESDIEGLGTENLDATSVEPMLGELDNLQALFEKSQELANQPLDDQEGATLPLEQPSRDDADAPEQLLTVNEQTTEAETLQNEVQLAEIAEPAPLVIVSDRAKSNQAVRVRSQLLDKLVNEAGEVTISRTRMETKLNQLRTSVKDITGNLDRLRRQLRDMELQTETQMQSRLQQTQSTSQNFDPLEFDRFTRVQEITRSMAESVDDISTLQRTLQRAVESLEDDLASQAGMTRALQQDLLRTRMMEFETLSERLYRVVRQASKESGKQVKLDIAGGTIEIDRNMLERMTPAFEHLLRNSVAHGIEHPDARRAKGKDATGTITIVVTQAGNDVAVEIRDDGAGLNADAIRKKAIERGLITPEYELTPAEVGQMIFAPGFSTATHVTELAGRGVGMDVVRNEVQSLGGRIETRYAADLGSSFKLVLPLTTAMTQVVMIRMGETVVGVPSSVVEIVRNLSREEIADCYRTGTYEYNKEKISFYWGGALLQDSQRSLDQADKGLPVMIFRSASQQIAVHVDEIVGNHEVVVKNLGPQLSRMPGLAAMTVLAEGEVALVYNPVALAAVYGERARGMTVPLDAEISSIRKPQENAPPLVMVVDDSITVRRVTQRFLQREGFRVELANDGLQALEKLRVERPMVVLSDIEMPRMDGFDLLRNIRSDESLADLPVIMITSRIAEKHREHAMELGASHYLGKPYSEDALLSLVRAYAKGEKPVMA